MKTSFLRITTGIAVVSLCTWKYSPRIQFIFLRSSPETVAAALRLNDGAAGGNKVQPSALSRSSSTADEGLGQLERDVAHAAQVADPDERANVLVAACLRWAEIDPADALRIARVLGIDQVSNAVCEDIIQKWAGRDFSSALAWAGAELAGEQRDHLMERLAYVRAQTQPSVAAGFVFEQISTGAVQTEAGISVLHQWALRDFEAAAAWANSFPRDLQNRGREELIGIARFRLARSDAR